MRRARSGAEANPRQPVVRVQNKQDPRGGFRADLGASSPAAVEYVGGGTAALHVDLCGKWAVVPHVFTVRPASYFPRCHTQLGVAVFRRAFF